MSSNGNPIPLYVMGLKTGPGLKIPPDSLCYVAAGNGLFKSVRSEFFELVVKEDGVAHLEKVEEGFRILLPRVPVVLFREAESFCVAVKEKEKAEAVVLLAANPKLGAWKLVCPKQTVTGGSAKYSLKDLVLEDGWALFGTIHSHPGAAFHSGTDDKDEYGFDGLHITIGNLDSPEHQYAVRWILSGHAFASTIHAVLDFPAVAPVAFNPEWMNNVGRETYAFNNYSAMTDHDWDGRGWDYETPAPAGGAAAGGNASTPENSLLENRLGSRLNLFTEEDIDGLDPDLVHVLEQAEQQYEHGELTFTDLAAVFDEVKLEQQRRDDEDLVEMAVGGDKKGKGRGESSR